MSNIVADRPGGSVWPLKMYKSTELAVIVFPLIVRAGALSFGRKDVTRFTTTAWSQQRLL